MREERGREERWVGEGEKKGSRREEAERKKRRREEGK